MTETRRRHLLKVLGTGVAAAVAGCIDGGEDRLLGSDDDGTGETGSGDEGSGDDGSGEDGSGDDGGSGEGGEPALDAVQESAESYVIEFELDEADEETPFDTWTGTQRVYGDDIHFYLEADGEFFVEEFVVDDATYTILEGDECFVEDRQPGDGELEVDPVDPAEPEDAVFIEESTLDGTDVYVFEDGDGYHIYTTQDTGWILRVEGEDMVAEVHSWDEVDPIEPPEDRCE